MDAIIIEKEALLLPESARALLADRLLESISKVSPELKTFWVNEAEERLEAYHQGVLSAVDGPKAMIELARQFAL